MSELKFQRSSAFQVELKQRVQAHFESSGLSTRDPVSMYVKTGVILGWMVLSYVGLNWLAETWWQVALGAVSLGLAMAGLGFNIQHDGNHGGYSKATPVNAVMAWSLDFIGGSSYVWRFKHNVIHHTYSNIAHVDADTDVGFFARLTPSHAHHGAHRFQHLYVWFLYMLLPFKWIFFDDFHELWTGRIGTQRFPRPGAKTLALTLLFKLQYVLWALVLPLALHPWQGVLLAYGLAAITLGLTLALVFQVAHCTGKAHFPTPDTGTARMENEWARHQVETTVDFARHSKVLTWFLGGLNFQVEHHLFPKICHVHYPAISRIVERTCRDFGVQFQEYATLRHAVWAHVKWLKQMGQAPA